MTEGFFNTTEIWDSSGMSQSWILNTQDTLTPLTGSVSVWTFHYLFELPARDNHSWVWNINTFHSLCWAELSWNELSWNELGRMIVTECLQAERERTLRGLDLSLAKTRKQTTFFPPIPVSVVAPIRVCTVQLLTSSSHSVHNFKSIQSHDLCKLVLFIHGAGGVFN